MRLKSPLRVAWQEQYVRLYLTGAQLSDQMDLTIDGHATSFQYTGVESSIGPEVLVKLGFEANQTKHLEWTPSHLPRTNLQHREITLESGAVIGSPGAEIMIPAPLTLPTSTSEVAGPISGFAGRSMESRIVCEKPFETARLYCVNDGPLFIDYVLTYSFADQRRYKLTFRCYKQDTLVEVGEEFSLGMNASLTWTINPQGAFDCIVSRDNFEGETQPVVESLSMDRTRDVLCRLQMPVLSEYFIPNNRGWFGFFDSRNEALGMVGFLGLYGTRWEAPADSMPELLAKGGAVNWTAPLVGGRRYWMLLAGPVEKEYTSDRRLVYHRLHAEFNQLRLDEHLDLGGDAMFDEFCWDEPGIFGAGDAHGPAQERARILPCLIKHAQDRFEGEAKNPGFYQSMFRYLLSPDESSANDVYQWLIERFGKWVLQFQGWRTGEWDYCKNVIGFSRLLRGMLIGYELLRKDSRLDDEQIGLLNAYFVFAARRITDEGRWPHDRTWRHPDHPESSRDLYTYGGEHKPDRLVWTNSLPNFQSDPLCALAHVSAMFKGHPDALAWRRKAIDELDRQLDAYCGKSGAWEESIGYALYTFSYLVITMRALKNRWGIDYFNDERVRRYAAWLCRFFGPYDKRFDAYTWPGIGNSVHPAQGGCYLLAYAAELPPGDPLRDDCIAIYQLQEQILEVVEHYGTVLAAMAPIPDRIYSLRQTGSECMDEVGVSMRMNALTADESYLFQKIGFAKDHYEGDETAFNWYAKGTPFLMDYGTYTGDVAVPSAHNIVEIPDQDPLKRGYLADHLFTPNLDYTRSEVPVTTKLLWGRVRTFAEVDDSASVGNAKTPYFYIGDRNPIGPKCWKVRCLLFVKPDYVVLFDRVYGQMPHRYNLHFTGNGLARDGQHVTGQGRFDLDLLAYIQHPRSFEMQSGTLTPAYSRPNKPDEGLKHAQDFIRLYNHEDGMYRTLLFAQERGRHVAVTSVGTSGMRVETDEYTDYVFLHNDLVDERLGEVSFSGRSGWIRRTSTGNVTACVIDGDSIEAFGTRFEGIGPWSYDLESGNQIEVMGNPPRNVIVTKKEKR